MVAIPGASRVADCQWAIGVYAGPSPLALAPHAGARNPVVTAADVTDVSAQFVADPFMVHADGLWHMFFEILNRDGERGEIGLALSPDALAWEYRGRVLVEPFHLSYPHVFRSGDDYYMTPETLDLGCVSLYRATRFPTHWERLAPLVRVRGADPTIFDAGGICWLLTVSPIADSKTVRLYSSPSLLGSWTEHPASPVVRSDPRRARPAGRVVVSDGRLIRFAQDCGATYGERVRALEIHELSALSYRESEVRESPVLCPTGRGWNASCMHHVDAHMLGDGSWIACVDGC